MRKERKIRKLNQIRIPPSVINQTFRTVPKVQEISLNGHTSLFNGQTYFDHQSRYIDQWNLYFPPLCLTHQAHLAKTILNRCLSVDSNWNWWICKDRKIVFRPHKLESEKEKRELNRILLIHTLAHIHMQRLMSSNSANQKHQTNHRCHRTAEGVSKIKKYPRNASEKATNCFYNRKGKSLKSHNGLRY